MIEQLIATAGHTEFISPLENRELRVCLIGAGKMSKFHIQTLQAMKGVSVAGISSHSGTSAILLGKEYGGIPGYSDWEMMIEEQQPDALIVAVSHSIAFEMYKAVLAKGIPCMLEKPAGYNSAQCEELLRIAETNQTLNMVGVNRRFYTNIQQALFEILHHGPIRGILVEMHEPLLDYRSRLQYEEWVYDQWGVANSIHGIDLFRMLAGEPKRILSMAKSALESKGDSFSASIEFENGTLGTYIAHFNSSSPSGVTIYGSGVTACVKPAEEGILTYSGGRPIRLSKSSKDIKFKQGLYHQNNTFMYAVATKEKPGFPASDLADHSKSIRLVEEIMQLD